MRKENEAIHRLTQIQSEVGTHYYIKKNGEIITMVPELYTAWHAGISQWGKYKMLNQYSIGIEITNPGHQFGYVNFSKEQIRSLIKLTKKLINKYKIKKNCLLGHSDIAPDRKLDPGEKFPWKILFKSKIGIWHNLSNKKLNSLRHKAASGKEISLFMKSLIKLGYPDKSTIYKNKLKFKKLLIKAFQRRFRPEIISGKIDQECLLIINKLTNIKV
jgi:N-acetylmuramoyl-L-alanine amidase